MFQRKGMFLVALALVLAGAIIHQVTRPSRFENTASPVPEALHSLRASVDSCRDAVDERRAELLEFDARVDSLRDRVRSLEALDARGVPADSYRTYLDAFDTYNRSVPEWSARADSIRGAWTECLELADRHNELADSMRRLTDADGDTLPR